jgi:hypothetical protein
MEAACQPAKRISVGEVLGETFSIYGESVVALVSVLYFDLAGGGGAAEVAAPSVRG